MLILALSVSEIYSKWIIEEYLGDDSIKNSLGCSC